MQPLLVDANIIIDLFTDDPRWGAWSQAALDQYSATHNLCINAVVYAEISIGFARIEELEQAIIEMGLPLRPIPREALFLAGKTFLQYRRAGGDRQSPLPDFFIGAHAAVETMPLLTRDAARFKTYFPALKVIHPA
ncbi:MAG: PIN domain-containing protein [Candidatus Latescibacteria bacterium]|nr:PIN domain-containing protein [Candidatus Latescibacterota bacterium]